MTDLVQSPFFRYEGEVKKEEELAQEPTGAIAELELELRRASFLPTAFPTAPNNNLKSPLLITEADVLASDYAEGRELVFSNLENLLLKACLCKKDIIKSE